MVRQRCLVTWLFVAFACALPRAAAQSEAGTPVEDYVLRLDELRTALRDYSEAAREGTAARAEHGRMEREALALRGAREPDEGLSAANPRDWTLQRVRELESAVQAEQLARRLGALRDEVQRSYDRVPRTAPGRRLLDDSRTADRSGEQSMSEILAERAYASRIEKAEREREQAEQAGQAGEDGDRVGFHRRPRRRIGPLYEDGDLRMPLGPEWRLPDLSWLGRGGRVGWKVVLMFLGSIGLVLLVYWIARAVMAPSRRRRNVLAEEEPAGAESDEAVRTRAPAELSASAARLARSGDFRGAVRVLYLELLARLYRAGMIRYDRTRTNWEYGLQLRSHAEVKGAFDTFTTIFDRAWYGRETCDESTYASCREEVLAIAEHLPMDA